MIYPDERFLEEVSTNRDRSLAELSNQQPVLLVFLRHFGCTFCREAIADLAAIQDDILAKGIQLVLVHMSNEKVAGRYFQRHELNDPEWISDPECELYRAFGLTKGTPRQLFGLHSWIRGFESGLISRTNIGTQLGDGFQMPGVFAIHKGLVKASFVHKLASDRPVYLDLVEKCCKT